MTVGVPACGSVKNRALVINHSVKYGNQIYIIDVDDENIIINKNVFPHQAGEIRHINASVPDKGVLMTSHNKSSLVFSLTGLDTPGGFWNMCYLSLCPEYLQSTIYIYIYIYGDHISWFPWNSCGLCLTSHPVSASFLF